MAGRHRSKAGRSPRLRVGDRVVLEFGGRKVEGTIIEDRGKIGFKGARLLTVKIERRDSDAIILEMPADDLQAA